MDLPMQVQRLCGDFENRLIKRPDFLEQCARLVADHVGCSRTGIWIFQGEKPALRMHCLAMFDGVNGQMAQVPDEEGLSVSDYFLALEQTGHVMATDARVHFATAGFFEQWLEPNGVKSLLAAAFSVNGRLYGAFTCAQVGEQMEWNRAQLAMLRQIGARISLALANADRVATDTQPALLSSP
jgi:GAF domain-containing protein